MKAAHILNKIEYSGSEIMLYQAAKLFGENGITTTLLSCEKQPGRFEQSMKDIGYAIDSLGSDSTINFLKKFYKYFRNNKFDVVHIHTEKLYLWKVILLRLTGHKNIVRTFHNCWIFSGFIRYKRIIHRRIAVFLGVKNHAIGLAVQENEQRIFRNKCFLINNWILPNKDLVNNSESIRTSKRAELGIDEDSFVMISVGGCSQIKNHSFIIDITKMLSGSGFKVTYLHVGTGADEGAEKAKVVEDGLSRQVIFTGNRNDVPELLICSDVYLMPSLYEGLSIAFLEAMYYNGVVIVNDARGLNNMVDNKVTGFIVDIAEIQDYVDVLKSIVKGERDVSAIKQSAGKFVEENFGLQKNASQLVEYYKLNTKFN